MPSFLKVRGYVFDTEALKDAYLAVPTSSHSTTTGYDEQALRALLRYFADWGPAREKSQLASPEDSLSNLSADQKRELYNEFTKQLSETVASQYSREIDQQAFEEFLHQIAAENLPQPMGTFLLQYLWRTSKRFNEYKQQLLSGVQPEPEDGNPASVSTLPVAIHRLPSEYLDQKHAQYKGDTKINRIRFQALETIRSEGTLSVESLQDYQQRENEKHATDIMRAYDEFTVLGQLYYDYFKPRIDTYLDEITTYLIEELDIAESTAHHVNFVQPRNQLGDSSWFAIYPTKRGSKSDAYQLFTGIRWDRVRFGLYAGDGIRDEGWQEEVDIDIISELDALTLERLVDKFDTVLQEYYRRNEMQSSETPEQPPEDVATTVDRQLRKKNQIVFYGPPGTGKTYEAQRFANWWVHEQTDGQPRDEQVQSVTFHPSFSYEDFIEGLTAEATDGGDVEYRIDDGILKRVAASAQRAYEQSLESNADREQNSNHYEAPPYVLIIDEINRGNLAQIFGETITLLENDKRGTYEVSLAHSDESFTLPPNLYVIGTMNTADRSIALVDAALRRRFRFIACPPAFEKVAREYGLPADPLQDGDELESLLWLSIVALEEVNDRIVKSADLGKGKQIGHTRLFGVETVDDLRDVWRFDILPLLEEYYFGQFNRIRRELFDGEGEELFDWERKQIRDFTVQELSDALSAFADGELELVYAETESGTSSSSADSRKVWDRESFFEEIESSFEQTVVDVYRDFYEFGNSEADRMDYGTGKRTGSVQFYWDEYQNGDRLVYEIRTDGALQFRFWGRHEYDEQLFEPFLEKINPLVDEPIDAEYLISDEFNSLQIPMERLQDDENKEQVKVAIREFIKNCMAAQ